MNWSVEEVVQFLCTPTKPQWAVVDPPNDLNSLETCLKSNQISGNILLNFVDHKVLREDLKVSCFRDRLFVSSGIKFLKENSPIFRSQEIQKEFTPHNDTEIPVDPPATASSEKISPKAPRRVQPIPATRGSPSQLPFLQESDDAKEKETGSAMERGSLESTPESIEGVDPTDLANLPPELQRLLRHHPPNFTGSVTSNSSSDCDLGYETESEHAPDTGKPRSSGLRLLPASDVDSEINTYIDEQRVRFQENVLPKHLHQALDYWNERGDRKLVRELARNKCHLQKRLENLKGAIHREKHTSRASVLQQCANIGQTVLDLCLVEWKQVIMSGSTCPDNISTERGNTLSRKPSAELEGEVILPSDEDDVEYHDKRVPAKRLHSPEERGPLQFVDTDDEDIDHFKLDEEMETSTSRHDSKRRRTPKTTSSLQHDACEPEIDPEKPLLSTEMAEVSHTDNAPVDIFDKVNRLTWSEVERSGNRECLLAKALMGLSPQQFTKFSLYLDDFTKPIYKNEIQEALNAMAHDEVEMEGNVSTSTYMPMTLASIFVSWVKRVKICAEGVELEHVNAASRALQLKLDDDEIDGQTSEFDRFWTMLNSLVTSYGKRKPLPEPTMPSGESRTTTKSKPGGSSKVRARLEAPLTSVQQEAQARQFAQEGAKLALEISTASQEISGNDPLKKPVTFKEPRIYLDSNLSRGIKEHQLRGVQFMFREITLTDPPEGCLLAHTMGLGKTMQV